MQIRTLKVVEYKGANVYLRNFGTTFEYLAVVKGQLYGSHITITRTPTQRLLGRDYTEKQLVDVCKVLTNMATATVDYVLANPEPPVPKA